MRTYEVAFIAAPTAGDEDLAKLTSQLEHVVTDKGGTVTRVEPWGRRRLAYRIGKFDDGIYTILYLEGTGQEIAEVERRLRVTDFILRHQTVRTDEDLKRAAKMKARRKTVAPGSPNVIHDDFDGDDE